MSEVKPEGIEELQEKDYRGLLALGFTAGFFASYSYGKLVPAIIGQYE